MTPQAPTIGKLLDTNTVIALIEGKVSVEKIIPEGARVYVSSITHGELRFGAYKSAHAEANLARIDKFTVDKIVLPCDATSADSYGKIKNQLRIKGRPIPDNDVWIAAIAAQNRLILVTRDQHFEEVDGLKLEKW